MRRPRPVPDLSQEPDRVLAQRAGEGDSQAFEQLYRRHAPAAWRVAYAVAGNADDAADAVSDAFTRIFQALPAGRLTQAEHFRPYLLAATRNAALDSLRKVGRLQPTSTVEELDDQRPAEFPDPVVQGFDAATVATAFRSLPERWRSVLWLTEVEGIPAREAAPLLGISPNGLSQLAVRARAGLRQRFLQAHLRAPLARACRFPVDHLGAYVAGGLSPRDTAKVDQHVAECADCAQRVEELEDVGPLLRKIVVPVPLALAAVTTSKWKLALGLAGSTRRLASSEALVQMRKPLAAVAVAMFALGVITATVLQQPFRSGPEQTGRGPLAAQAPPVIQGFDPESPPEQAGFGTLLTTAAQDAVAPVQDQLAAAPGAGTGPGTGPGGGGLPRDGFVPNPPDGGDDPPPAGEPTLELSALLLQETGAASLGVGDDSCTGLKLGPIGAGCQPAPGDGVLTLRTRGLLGNNTISPL